jgi:hypothetical protein
MRSPSPKTLPEDDPQHPEHPLHETGYAADPEHEHPPEQLYRAPPEHP